MATKRKGRPAAVPRPDTPAPPPSSPQVRRLMVGNRGKDTAPERRLRSALHARGLRFRKHARPIRDLRCLADVVFPSERVAVFVDGCFWHGCPEHGRKPSKNSLYWAEKLARNEARDRRNGEALAGAGWLVLRYWEHVDVQEATEEVTKAVLARRRERRLGD